MDQSKSTSHRPKKRKLDETEKVTRVYADGIFDLFHFAHARLFEQCKGLFPNVYLIVGVCDDESTRKHKGKTVFTHDERAESVRHCRWVDEVVKNAPWVIDQAFLDKHQIDYVAHDGLPYPHNEDDVYRYVKSVGKFAPTTRTEGISTSEIINRVVKDYDNFVRRNLKRGYSRQEMNLGFLREKRIKVSGKMGEVKDKVHRLHNKMKDKGDEVYENSKFILKKWIENSEKYIDDFLMLFGKEGKVNTFVKDHVNSIEEKIMGKSQSRSENTSD